MKRVLLILTFAIMVSLVCISGVRADVLAGYKAFTGTINDTGSVVTNFSSHVTDFDSLGFVCADNMCSNVTGSSKSFLTKNSSGNMINIVYPRDLQGAGYGVYFYKRGYLPYEVFANWNGDGTAPTRNITFAKKKMCRSDINLVDVKKVGNGVNITIEADSPMSNAGPDRYIPAQLSDYYSAMVDFRIDIDGPMQASDRESVRIPFSQTKKVSFFIPNVEEGVYTINASVKVDDEKCLSSLTTSSYKSFSTNGSSPVQVGNILIVIENPLHRASYSHSPVDLKITAENATSIWYNLNNGENITYTEETDLAPKAGINYLNVYANNSAYFKQEWLYFSFVPNPNDRDPPVFSAFNAEFPSQTTYNASMNYRFSAIIEDESGIGSAVLNLDGRDINMKFNGTYYYVNITGISAGNHTYYFKANDSLGNNASTRSKNFTITKAQSICYVNSSSTNVVYPMNITITAGCNHNESAMSLLRNGISVLSENNQSIILSPGSYNYNASVGESQNYSAHSAGIMITVNSNGSIGNVNGSTNTNSGSSGNDGSSNHGSHNGNSLNSVGRIQDDPQNLEPVSYNLGASPYNSNSKSKTNNSVLYFLIGLLILSIIIAAVLITMLTRRKSHLVPRIPSPQI